jgi:hypothetical protein
VDGSNAKAMKALMAGAAFVGLLAGIAPGYATLQSSPGPKSNLRAQDQNNNQKPDKNAFRGACPVFDDQILVVLQQRADSKASHTSS